MYVGGEQRMVLPQNDVQWVLAFETKGWNAEQMFVSKVVQALLGDSTASRNSRLRNNLVLS